MHRNEFKKEEIEVLRKLIEDKCKVDSSTQKRVRDKMRDLGFYITDYTSTPRFTVMDFDNLIKNGKIKEVG